MFTLSKDFLFEAAHRLPKHDGICRGLHGHSYRFSLEVVGQKVITSGPKSGMVMDFKDLGIVGKEIVAKLDHKYLNDLFEFDTTAENLSRWMFEFMRQRIPQAWAVRVKETESSEARYCPAEGRIWELGKLAIASIRERLESSLILGGADDCWLFIGSKDYLGYGYFCCAAADTKKAHRVMAWLSGMDIDGKVVMHTCDNPSCCNPNHLKVGTHAENEADKDVRGRRPKGESHALALLTDAQVLVLWRDYQKHGKEKEFVHKWMARLHITSPQYINNITQGRNWNHITGLPKRKK